LKDDDLKFLKASQKALELEKSSEISKALSKAVLKNC
jgi:hypothetical protein